TVGGSVSRAFHPLLGAVLNAVLLTVSLALGLTAEDATKQTPALGGFTSGIRISTSLSSGAPAHLISQARNAGRCSRQFKTGLADGIAGDTHHFHAVANTQHAHSLSIQRVVHGAYRIGILPHGDHHAAAKVLH